MRRGRPLRRTGSLRRSRLQRRRRVRPRSERREAEASERAALVRELLTERPYCEWPGCGRPPSDVHEVLPRARGGSILDRDNCRVLCRHHHDYLHHTDEGQREAERFGLLRHSWDQ